MKNHTLQRASSKRLQAVFRLFTHPLLVASFVATLIAPSFLSPAIAQCSTDALQKLMALDAFDGDHLGEAVAVHGDVAVLGAPQDDDLGLSSGAAYVFRYDGSQWLQEQKLVSSGGSDADYFGLSVSVYGNVIVVGTQEHSGPTDNAGSAYVFRYDGVAWAEEQVLSLNPIQPGALFGRSVDVYENTIVVGADGIEVDTHDNAGSVFVYQFGDDATWSLIATLEAPDASEDAFLGHSVAIDEHWIIAGAVADNDVELDGGSAYLYTNLEGVWNFYQKITPAGLAANDHFGTIVDISGHRAVASAPYDDLVGNDNGAVFVFEMSVVGDPWFQVAHLTASDAQDFDRLGIAAAIHGNTVLAGSYDDDPGNISGAGYLFRFNGFDWVEQTKIEPADLLPGDQFASAVAINDTHMLLGSPLNDDADFTAGAAYLAEVPELSLVALQSEVLPGGFIDFQACGGISGEPLRVELVEAFGMETSRFVMQGVFLPDGTWADTYLVPPAISATTLGFEATTSNDFAGPVQSNRVTVEVN